MKYIAFDVETTGLPKDWKAPVTDFENWPRVVELAYMIFDDHGYIFLSKAVIVKPEGYEIPDDVVKIHGISTERALAEGIPAKDVFTEFVAALEEADMVVGHNVSFDRKVVGADLLRHGFEDHLHGQPRICTMWSSKQFCNLPSKNGSPKLPKLKELYEVLFGEEPGEMHTAAGDVEATVKCFLNLRDMNVIPDSMLHEEIERAKAG